MSATLSCQPSPAWSTRSSSVPSQMLSSRTGLCGSKPVELSAKSAAQLARLPWRRTEVLPENSANAPLPSLTTRCWTSSDGVVWVSTSEHAHYVTDAVLAVPEDPPAVVQLDPYPLLFHARDDALDVVESNMSCHRKDGSASRCLPLLPTKRTRDGQSRAGVPRCP